MTTLSQAVDAVLRGRAISRKPLAAILAGHNGSGKSTLWYRYGLADRLGIPLINADRMMLSILPETDCGAPLPEWARAIRDEDMRWMEVSQRGVEAFTSHAMGMQLSFATETVFSHWKALGNGQFESKIDRIRELQDAGYFVVLFFVGLANVNMSISRVRSRVTRGGHDVGLDRLQARFPRTQTAIRHALPIADAAILVDNTRDRANAFTVCRVQLRERAAYDIRDRGTPPAAVLAWLDVVSPR